MWFKLLTREPRPNIFIIDDPVTAESEGWTSAAQILDLGAPSGTALNSMSIGLSTVIEYIYHTEEQSALKDISLSVKGLERSNSMSNSMM